MRKLTLLVVIALCCVPLLSVKKPGEEYTVKSDTLQLQFIPSFKHDLVISYSNRFQRLLFVDTIYMLKTSLEARGMDSFILNRDLVLEKVSVNQNPVYVTEYKNVKSTNFLPRIRLQTMTDIKGKCRIMQFAKGDISEAGDTVKVIIKYYLPISDTLKYFVSRDGKISMDGWDFWYPRNLHQDENIQLTVNTMGNVEVALNDDPLTCCPKGVARVHSREFTDRMEYPQTLSFKITR